MPIDWIWGLLGGLMIGCGGAVFLLGSGRIMGASGLLGGLIDRTAGGTTVERLCFFAGVIGLPFLLTMVGMSAQTNVTPDWFLLIGAGLLVGLGTRIGNGCTSGHGVCGISRLSPRGIVATLVYIGAGVLTVLAMSFVGAAP